MVVKDLVNTAQNKSTEDIISDTTMMFMACAVYTLCMRNNFSKQEIAQFLADVEQVNRDNSYEDLRLMLNEKYNLEFPEVK